MGRDIPDQLIHWVPWRPRRAARFGARLSGIRPDGALPPPCSTARSLTFGQAGHVCRGCMQACARPRQRRANNASSPTPSVIATVVALPRAGMTRGAVVVLSLPALHPSCVPLTLVEIERKFFPPPSPPNFNVQRQAHRGRRGPKKISKSPASA